MPHFRYFRPITGAPIIMFYCPQYPSGEPIPIPWPIAVYRRLNHICWPLSDGVGTLIQFFDRCVWLIGFLVFVQHSDAELRYLMKNVQNLDEFLSGVPTYLVLNEFHLRSFHLGWHKEQFKCLLQRFYAEIYVDKSEQPKKYGTFRRRLRPLFAFCTLYINAVSSYVVIGVYNIIFGYRTPIFKMIYPFDISSAWVYVPIVLSNIWVGTIVTSTIIGEDCVISEVLIHLEARYQLMKEELQERTRQLLQRADSRHIATDFQNILVKTIEENIRLHKFSEALQREFSFRIFIMLAFSATMLCALSFKVYTNPFGSYAFLSWMFAKILEMILIGEFGSAIMVTTDKVSTMYYESGWESIIQRSSDTKANVRVMKLVLTAIGTSQKPFILLALNFFSVSLTTVLSILQGAFSYFTCLVSVHKMG